MKLLALVTESKSVARYLRAIGEPTETPGRSPSRGAPYQRSVVLRQVDPSQDNPPGAPPHQGRPAPAAARAGEHVATALRSHQSSRELDSGPRNWRPTTTDQLT